MYIANSGNYRVRKLTISTGIITTVAGTGIYSYSGDGGAATSATMTYPIGIALDSAGIYQLLKLFYRHFQVILLFLSLGNVYFADQYNHRIRKVTISTGIITTIAGTGTSSYSGDNGPATSATLNFPAGVTVDSSGSSLFFTSSIASSSFCTILSLSLGNVYIADVSNNRIRKVTVSTGIITTYAGTGTGSFSGDNGPATSATLYSPADVKLDASGTISLHKIDET